jgi:hypothetical protein
VNDTLESLTGRINNIEIRLTEVESKQTAHESEMKVIKDSLKNISNRTSSGNEFYDEIELRLSKKENIILSGVPEIETGSLSDRKAADENHLSHIMKELDVQDFEFKRIERIGRVSAKRRLLKVSGLDFHKRQEVLRKSKGLRNSNQYKRVYINADLTPMQREKQRELQGELRDRRLRGEDVIIYRGRVQLRNQAHFH